MSSQEKSPDAFRTISEVAEDLDLPQHVLRFWETRFSQIKPLKRGGGRRYYRPDDVELLKGIRHLLYGEGYTIKGVQRILKEQGARFVMQMWHEDAVPLQAAGAAVAGAEERVGDRSVSGGLAAAVATEKDVQTPPRDLLPNGVLADNAPEPGTHGHSGALGILGRLRGEKPTASHSPAQATVSKEDIRRLQATLFELLECKRTLDQARFTKDH